MTAVIVIGFVALLVAGIVLSRNASNTKKGAIEDLKREKEQVGTFDIFDLVESEVEALDLTEIDGAQDVPHHLLLKVWSESQDVVENCADRSHLRYVLADGVDPADAANGDVTLECRKGVESGDQGTEKDPDD